MIITTKFNIGQTLYRMHENKAQAYQVEAIHLAIKETEEELAEVSHLYGCRYTLFLINTLGKRIEVYEYELATTYFLTKEELLASL